MYSLTLFTANIVLESEKMNIPLTLLIVGILLIIISFFIGNSSRSHADDLEKVSISLYQETSGLKKRLRVIEEELMIGIGSMASTKQSKKPKAKAVHEIIVNQILTLHTQGFSVKDIAQRSSLTDMEVIDVLRAEGVM